jgi:hypothetical protein
MSKLKFSVALPIMLLLVSIAFFRGGDSARLPKGWDTPYTPPLSLICVGISAPAFPMTYGAPSSEGMDSHVSFRC